MFPLLWWLMAVCNDTVTHRHTMKSVGLQRRKTGIQAENWISHTAASCTAFEGPPVPTNIKEAALVFISRFSNQTFVSWAQVWRPSGPKAKGSSCSRGVHPTNRDKSNQPWLTLLFPAPRTLFMPQHRSQDVTKQPGTSALNAAACVWSLNYITRLDWSALYANLHVSWTYCRSIFDQHALETTVGLLWLQFKLTLGCISCQKQSKSCYDNTCIDQGTLSGAKWMFAPSRPTVLPWKLTGCVKIPPLKQGWSLALGLQKIYWLTHVAHSYAASHGGKKNPKISRNSWLLHWVTGQKMRRNEDSRWKYHCQLPRGKTISGRIGG